MPEIIIPGAPPKVTAQMMRWRCMRMNGKMLPRPFKSPALKKAEKFYMDRIEQQIPLEGPIECELFFVWPWRKSEPKSFTNRNDFRWSDKRPDADNLAKMFLDICTKRGIWKDDSQVASLLVQKSWAEHGSTFFSYKTLE